VVKYLGVLLSPNSSSNIEISRRLSQANAAFKLLRPFFKLKTIPLKWRLSVYNQILGSIMNYALDSLSIDQTGLNRLDAFHFKVLRRCLGVKSSFYHKVVAQTNNECSNYHLHKLVDRLNLTLCTPSQHTQDASLKLFGHIVRHPEELAHKILFGSCNQTRTLRSSNRIGKPRLHWLENMLTLSLRRIDISEHGILPKVGLLFHPYFTKVTSQEVSAVLGSSIYDRIDITSQYKKVSVAARNQSWHKLTHTKK
jgi:hypothetical protein